MGFFSRLLGTAQGRRAPQPQRAARPPGSSEDALAIQRYRYMLQTASPETLEQAHAEAFAKLSPAQRRQVVQQLAQTAPPEERAAIEGTSTEDSRALARLATRAEIRQPGVLERTLSQPSLGFGAGLLGSFAAGFVGSMVAQSFFSAMGGFGGAEAAAVEDPAEVAAEDPADDDFGIGDLGGDDFSGGDFGGGL